MNSELASAIGATIAGAAVLYILIAVALAVLMIIAYWKIFTKAGEKGWKSIILFYNGHVMYKITWKPLWFWLLLAAAVVCSAFESKYSADQSVMAYGIIAIVAGIFEVVIIIKQLVYLSKSFGKSGGFAVGLLLLPVIFYPILAFGSAKYIGNAYQLKSAPKAEEQ